MPKCLNCEKETDETWLCPNCGSYLDSLDTAPEKNWDLHILRRIRKLEGKDCEKCQEKVVELARKENIPR